MLEKMNYQLFTPIKQNKDATVIFTHGIAEYSKSYLEFAENLKNAGYHVITYDLRGHGKSKSERGTVNSYNDLLEDLDYLVKKAYTKTSKVFLYGHSLGGVITNLYVSKGNVVDGVIITASPIKLTPLLKFLKLLPRKMTNKIKIQTNFNDKNLAHENKYIKDENDLDFFYFKYINEVLIKGLKDIKKGVLNEKMPSLYIYSLNDKMAKIKNGEILYKRTLNADKTLLKYEKSRHNLHLDIEKGRLFKDVIKWLNNH